MITYTFFCQESGNLGTIHIDTVEAADLDSAILAGREQCINDWNGNAEGEVKPFTLADIHCLGVAAGDITILHWEDQVDQSQTFEHNVHSFHRFKIPARGQASPHSTASTAANWA